MKNTKPLITFTAPALGGGIGRTIVNLANAFVDLDYPVNLLLDEPQHLYEGSLRAGIETHHLETSNVIGGVLFFGNYIRRQRPSVLLTPVVRHTMLAVRTKYLLRAQFKIFPLIHNTYSRSFWNLAPGKKDRCIRKIRKYYSQCDGIIAVSRGVADDLCTLTGFSEDRVKTLYNAVVTEELGNSALDQVDHPWFTPGQPPVIISVGRLHFQKNYPLLIESFELVRRHMRCRLMIVGDGDEREDLEARARSSVYSDDIHLTGHQNNPFALVKRSSVFVLSSLYEGLPTVLIEALAVGTPVVSTDCMSGPAEILDHGRYGPIVPMGDPEALSRAIMEVLRNPLPSETLIKASERYRDRNVAVSYLRAFGMIGGGEGLQRSSPSLSGDE
ncbi:glycosyltransferase [bacterium]|nr:glycosyltransferase [bacterium]